MKKLFALVAIGLLILGAASCDTKNVGVPMNALPTIDSVTYVAPVLTVTVSDINNDTVTVGVTVPAGLAVDLTPKTAAATGSATFTWSATDAAAGGSGTTTITATDSHGAIKTATQLITIAGTAANTAPQITNVAYAGSTLTVTVADAETSDVIVTVTEPTGLTANSTSFTVPGGDGVATFTWTGAAGANGETTITANDGALTDTATQLITIPVANTAPEITAVTYVEPLLTVTVADAETEDVVVSVTEPTGLTANVTSFTVTGGDGPATFTWTGAGTGDTTITASDGALTDTATQAITVTPNNAPVIGTITWAAPVLTVAVTDADAADTITVAVTNPAGLTADMASKTVVGGTVSFTFTGSGSGDTTITATDGKGGSDTATQTITISGNEAPVIGAVTYAGGVLTVPVTDPDAGDTLEVSVTVPAGLAVDIQTQPGIANPGTATFIWSATDFLAGGSGETTITVRDNGMLTDTATQMITITASVFAADNLYVVPAVDTTTVGTPVTMYVVTGDPAHDLQFMSSVAFTVETDAAYVTGSFNLGVPGGGRMDSDGYWALLGSGTPPTAGQYLDLGDSFMPGTPTAISATMERYTFAVVTMGSFDAPTAAMPNGAVLYTFQLTFATAGTYNLGFQLNDGATPPVDQTFYADAGGTSYYWNTLVSDTITVN